MEEKQIKSLEIKPTTPSNNYGSIPENVDKADPYSESFRRKKLRLYFAESDERRTSIGGADKGGTTPVNIRGKPIENLSRTGGWIAAFFIFGNEMAERMAYFGLSVNMAAFMFYVMYRPFSSLQMLSTIF